nr:MFS transporter [uncultured Roseateles sp.]
MLSSASQRLRALGRPFRLLLISDALMLVSLMVSHVAVPWWVAHQGGAQDLALYAGLLAAISFVALPLLSPLGDRYSKRSLITAGMVAMLVESVALAAIAQAGIYHVGLVIALQIVSVVAMAVISPASMSIVAELLPPEQLTEGLGYQKSAQAIGRLIGPVLGGTALALGGTALALWLLVVLMMVATPMAARIETPPKPARRHSRSAWMRDLRAGLAAKWQIPMERGWSFVSFLVMVFFVPGVGMLVPLKVQSLGLSGAWLGACEAGLSVGMLAGSLGLSARLADRVGRFHASFGAILCEGLCLMAMGLTHQPWVMVLAFAGFGLCVATVMMVGHTHRMLAMPPDFRARMTAVNMMVMQIAGTLGPGLAGLGLMRLQVDQVYLLFGLGLFCVGLGYTRVPGYKQFLNLPHEQAQGLYGREHPQLFRPFQDSTQVAPDRPSTRTPS